MRVVLDTNVLLSALINPGGRPAQLITAWRDQRFELVTSSEQLLELGEVARRPVLRARILPPRVGRFINDLRKLADVLRRLPNIDRSVDPADNFLLAMAEAGNADYLVSGDHRGVLALRTHGPVQIVNTRRMTEVLYIKAPQPPRANEVQEAGALTGSERVRYSGSSEILLPNEAIGGQARKRTRRLTRPGSRSSPSSR